MRPTFSLLTAVALLAVPLVAGAETLVEVGHNRLEPAAITITSGDTVTFVNKDQMPDGHPLPRAWASTQTRSWALSATTSSGLQNCAPATSSPEPDLS